MPEKWRPYFKQAVEDWQVAFEQAGFSTSSAYTVVKPSEASKFVYRDALWHGAEGVERINKDIHGEHTEAGDPLDLELIREDIIRLENLAIFGSVVVTPRPLRDGVALDFAFTEMPWIIPFPALRYTEENGFSVGLGVASRRRRGA